MAGATGVSPEMAVRLGKLCGNGAELWLSMQARYDAWEARQRLGRRLQKIPTLTWQNPLRRVVGLDGVRLFLHFR
jgi:plasmid maintenance system antidote protein VapI